MTKAPWITDCETQWEASSELRETQITKARLLLETGSITVDEAEELSAFLQGEDVDVSAILESHSQI